jgi:hypothetical protein
LRWLAAAVVVVAVAVVAIVLETRRPPPHLLVGVDDDTAKWLARPDSVLRLDRELGVEAVRLWIPWRGAVAPRGLAATYLRRAEGLANGGQRVVLAVFGFRDDAPLTAAQRDRYCTFVGRALALAPSVRDVVVWNEANSRTYWPTTAGAPAYAALLARCWDVVHALDRPVNVIDSTASRHGPEAFLRRLGDAYRVSGRRRPLVDVFGHNPYPNGSTEPPETRHRVGMLGEGDYERLVSVLRAAFRGTAQPIPGGEDGASIWYLEDGFQTVVPPAKLARYTGRETSRSLLSPAAQALRLRAALVLAACQPAVGAFFNFELTDEVRLAGWQSGLLWRGGKRKPAFEAFRQSIADIRAGRVDCER